LLPCLTRRRQSESRSDRITVRLRARIESSGRSWHTGNHVSPERALVRERCQHPVAQGDRIALAAHCELNGAFGYERNCRVGAVDQTQRMQRAFEGGREKSNILGTELVSMREMRSNRDASLLWTGESRDCPQASGSGLVRVAHVERYASVCRVYERIGRVILFQSNSNSNFN
jgi:hypothetical protein